MVLDLIAHFPKKYVYKDPSQREAWGSFDYSMILPGYSQESSWRAFFPRGKSNWYRTFYPRYGSLTLGALIYLHVGTNSRVSRFKLKMVPGHGWVERGSSQVIRLSI